jgi:hypothetical protein
MIEFLKFMDELRKGFPFHLQIYYSKIVDWCITVQKKGCADEYPDAIHLGEDVVICQVSDPDMELCFARAHIAVKEWLLEHEGGY